VGVWFKAPSRIKIERAPVSASPPSRGEELAKLAVHVLLEVRISRRGGWDQKEEKGHGQKTPLRQGAEGGGKVSQSKPSEEKLFRTPRLPAVDDLGCEESTRGRFPFLHRGGAGAGKGKLAAEAGTNVCPEETHSARCCGGIGVRNWSEVQPIGAKGRGLGLLSLPGARGHPRIGNAGKTGGAFSLLCRGL